MSPDEVEARDGTEAGGEGIDEDFDATLISLISDMGGPLADVDWQALTPTERRTVLACLRERLGMREEDRRPEA